MAVKDVFKVTRKTFVNPRGWFGYDQVRNYTLIIWGILRGLFVVDKPTHVETFEQAMQRLNLSEQDIKETNQTYIIYTILFFILGLLGTAISSYYLLHHGSLAGFVLGLAASALLFTQAFRFHFWHFQIKFRKLGCTFAEWRRGKPFDHEENR